MREFKLNHDADVNGTCFQGNILASPATVVKTFGTPSLGDEYKVSHEWIFQATKDPSIVFALYNWKNTSRYDQAYQSPKDFAARTDLYAWHIGCTEDNWKKYGKDFEEWFNNTLV